VTSGTLETKSLLLASLYDCHANELAACLEQALAGNADVARCNRILQIRKTFKKE
jgi:hypothetical protein